MTSVRIVALLLGILWSLALLPACGYTRTLSPGVVMHHQGFITKAERWRVVFPTMDQQGGEAGRYAACTPGVPSGVYAVDIAIKAGSSDVASLEDLEHLLKNMRITISRRGSAGEGVVIASYSPDAGRRIRSGGQLDSEIDGVGRFFYSGFFDPIRWPGGKRFCIDIEIPDEHMDHFLQVMPYLQPQIACYSSL